MCKHTGSLKIFQRKSFRIGMYIVKCTNYIMRVSIKAPLYTKLTLMDCGIGNTNLLGSSSSVLGYDCFNMKSTDGATMYFNLGSGIGSGRIQTDYWVKLREKDEK